MRNFWFVLLLVLLPLAGWSQSAEAPELAHLVRQVSQMASQELPAPLLREARRGLSTAKRTFGQNPLGRPAAGRLYVVGRVLNEAATPELVVVAVDSWRGNTLRGRILRTTNGQTTASAPAEFDEATVRDWLLLHPDGREEGNYLGKFWDLEDRLAERGQ